MISKRVFLTVAMMAAVTLGGVTLARERKQAQAKAAAPVAACADRPLVNLDALSVWTRNARIVPEIRDGQATGFRMYSVVPSGAMDKVGIKNGDLITKLAGMPLLSPEGAHAAYKKMRESPCATITVERNGQELELTFRSR